jgi:hypothetical protein
VRAGIELRIIEKILGIDDFYPYHPQLVQKFSSEIVPYVYSFVKWLQPMLKILSDVMLSPQTPYTCNGVDRSRNTHSLAYRHPYVIVTKQFSTQIFCRSIVWNARRLSACTTFYRGTHNGYLFHELSRYLEDTIFDLFLIKPTDALDGFGGLLVSMLASGTQGRGFKPGRNR